MAGYIEPVNNRKAVKVRKLVKDDQMEEANRISLELADYLKSRYPDRFHRYVTSIPESLQDIELPHREAGDLSDAPDSILAIWDSYEGQINGEENGWELEFDDEPTEPQLHDIVTIKGTPGAISEVLEFFIGGTANQPVAYYSTIHSASSFDIVSPALYDFLEQMGLTIRAANRLYDGDIMLNYGYWPDKVSWAEKL
jgi:hypothetical protein